MIPFPYLPYNNEDGFFIVCIKQVNKLFGYRYGCYRIENDILIGKNGQISIEEFMKEVACSWKSKTINSKHTVEHNCSIFKLLSREDIIIKVSAKDCAYFLNFSKLSMASFLNKEDFLRTIPCLLFDNEQYVGIGCL